MLLIFLWASESEFIQQKISILLEIDSINGTSYLVNFKNVIEHIKIIGKKRKFLTAKEYKRKPTSANIRTRYNIWFVKST